MESFMCGKLIWIRFFLLVAVFSVSASRSFADEVGDYEKRMYKITFSKNKNLCDSMLGLQNSNIDRYGAERYAGPYFDAIKWRRVNLFAASPARDGNEVKLPAEIAEIDLYNDGGHDVVVRYQSGGGPFVNEIRNYVSVKVPFATDIESRDNIKKSDLLAESDWVGPRRLAFYSSNHLESIENPEVTEPFYFDGSVYFSVRELPRYDLNNGFLHNKYNYSVILKYRRRGISDLNGYIDRDRRISLRSVGVRQGQFLDVVCVFSK
ncbi:MULTISPECIES: hypothetical protein [Ralstonia solanacearum species complex]|uniref:hypothetical protein n=1 Tax=Ralstonia solanacearum species complex TaxID=3116862 RepID=UPI0011404612|nr:hypothetical protein [Ralstonia solanacearum]